MTSERQRWTPACLLSTGFWFVAITTTVLAAQAVQAGLVLTDPLHWKRMLHIQQDPAGSPGGRKGK